MKSACGEQKYRLLLEEHIKNGGYFGISQRVVDKLQQNGEEI